jgi:hypothetical protein
MNKPQEDSEGYNLLQGMVEVLPLLMLLGSVGGTWFNLQSQVTELRARYESSTGATKDALSDMKDDLKENTVLLRQLLRDNNRMPNGAPPLPQR